MQTAVKKKKKRGGFSDQYNQIANIPLVQGTFAVNVFWGMNTVIFDTQQDYTDQMEACIK